MQALKLCRLAEHLKFDPQPFETEQLKTLVLKICQFGNQKDWLLDLRVVESYFSNARLEFGILINCMSMHLCRFPGFTGLTEPVPMNREDGDSSNSGDYHNSRRLEPRENYVHGGMMTQYSGFQPTYSVVSYVYYYPWVDPTTYPVPSSYGEAGRRGAAHRTSPLADGNGGFYITAAGTSSWWDQSRSSRASSGGDRHFATTYMLCKNSLCLLRLELHLLALVPDGFFSRYLFRSALSLPAFFVPGFLHVI